MVLVLVLDFCKVHVCSIQVFFELITNYKIKLFLESKEKFVYSN